MNRTTQIHLLAPPRRRLPEVEADHSWLTPGGGCLYTGIRCDHPSLQEWTEDASLEVWEVTAPEPGLRAHIHHCKEHDSFREICTELALTGMHILQVETRNGDAILKLSDGAEAKAATMHMRPLSERLDTDISIVGAAPSPSLTEPGCLLMDMDSTLIRCECIDEIGDFLGIKEKIAAITRRAMEGELDFAASLTQRVALLAGLEATVLDEVYEQRIRLTDGAERLIATLHEHGWKVGVVSGGFTYFTDKLQAHLQLDFALSNRLEIVDSRLTGRVLGEIVDAEAKRIALTRQAEAWSIPMRQTVAIGDGANDLPMIEAAGLGIAFHAKPKVRELAPYAISHGGLDRALDLLV
ncbi:MAG TPA: phosphoserine phosphatase SerB [Mariprofundaceae bacterium]|nr:phosphoserine phosphatase SerB [Mariprofundaceae bacterium]